MDHGLAVDTRETAWSDTSKIGLRFFAVTSGFHWFCAINTFAPSGGR